MTGRPDSLGQLKLCWPEGQDQTLLSNVTQVYFGVNDQQTAEYVSNRLGDETILVRNWGSNSGSSHQASPQAVAGDESLSLRPVEGGDEGTQRDVLVGRTPLHSLVLLGVPWLCHLGQPVADMDRL